MICPGVEGENLAARALAALRERGWDAPPLRIEIEKRTPVAAGLGGGSADAAAVLRLAADDVPFDTCPHTGQVRTRRAVADLPAIAAELGADVPSQLRPGLALVRGAGRGSSRSRPRPSTRRCCCPAAAGSRPRRSSPRPTGSGSAARSRSSRRSLPRLRAAAGSGASPLAYVDLLVNDLEPAAISASVPTSARPSTPSAPPAPPPSS